MYLFVIIHKSSESSIFLNIIIYWTIKFFSIGLIFLHTVRFIFFVINFMKMYKCPLLFSLLSADFVLNIRLVTQLEILPCHQNSLIPCLNPLHPIHTNAIWRSYHLHLFPQGSCTKVIVLMGSTYCYFLGVFSLRAYFLNFGLLTCFHCHMCRCVCATT